MRAAHFEVSRALLRDALRLPLGARIKAVWSVVDGNVHLVVEDDTLPESNWPHECTPTVTTYDEWDWNVR